MKNFKKYLCLFAILLMFIPFISVKAEDTLTTTAIETYNGFEVVGAEKATSDKIVNGSSILAGNTVNGKNTVNGIGMLFGNDVTFSGASDYSLLAGNNVDLDGTIKNDGVVFGNIITFDKAFKIDRDLFVFGNDVTLDGSFNRDVTIFASSVTINGIIKGNVTINAENVTINSEAIILGTLKYNKDASADISSNNIGSTQLTEEMSTQQTFGTEVVSTLMSLAEILVVYMAFALILPALFKRMDSKIKDISWIKALTLMGYGALTLIAVPMALILLISFVFGISLAFIIGAVYVIAIMTSTMFSGYLLGNVIWAKFIKKDKNLLLTGLLGISIIYILKLIPVVGTFVSLISLLVGMGLVMKLFKKD